MVARALRAAILDARVFRELGDDPQEMMNALLVVLTAAVAFGLGVRSLPEFSVEGVPPIMVVLTAVSTIMTSWLLWAGVSFVVGTLIFRGHAGFRQLLRSLGLAYGPGVLSLFASIPTAGGFMIFISLLWLFPTGLVAIRETQNYDWIRAFVTAAIGWILSFMILPGLMLFNPFGNISP